MANKAATPVVTKRDKLPRKNRFKISAGVQTGTRIKNVDNSGVKEVEVIGVIGYRGIMNRLPRASVSDIVVASVKKGKPELKGKIVYALIISQKMVIRRKNGERIAFEDIRSIILDSRGDPRGTGSVNSPVAKEVAEKFARVGSMCSNIH